MKKFINSAIFSMGIICLVMAFLVTLQIKSVMYNHATATEESLRIDDLLKQLNDARTKNEKLTELNASLRLDIQDFKDEASENSDFSKTIISQLERAEIMAGMVEVSGNGIIITVRDSAIENTIGDLNNYIIHDTDLLSIINELCDAGAEAISLNNERIISTSEIRCAGATVSVNNNRYAQPFTIKAIGDPVNMENAILMRGGVYDTLTAWGIDLEINKATDIKIPAYNGIINYKYAKPLTAEESEGN